MTTISVPIRGHLRTPPTESDTEMVGTEKITGTLITIRDTKTGKLLAAEFHPSDGRMFVMEIIDLEER